MSTIFTDNDNPRISGYVLDHDGYDLYCLTHDFFFHNSQKCRDHGCKRVNAYDCPVCGERRLCKPNRKKAKKVTCIKCNRIYEIIPMRDYNWDHDAIHPRPRHMLEYFQGKHKADRQQPYCIMNKKWSVDCINDCIGSGPAQIHKKEVDINNTGLSQWRKIVLTKTPYCPNFCKHLRMAMRNKKGKPKVIVRLDKNY